MLDHELLRFRIIEVFLGQLSVVGRRAFIIGVEGHSRLPLLGSIFLF